MFSAVVGLNLPMVATASRGMVLVVMFGAHFLDLKERKVYATGYDRNELYTPLAALVKVGCTPLFANPNGGHSFDGRKLQRC
jgi:hypothetical protein